MEVKVLAPSVENGEEPDLCAQMAGIACNFEQRLGTGPEQQTVDDLLVLQGQRGEPVRKSEDHVHIGSGQQFPTARLQPTVAGVGLTLGTVPIPARIVRDAPEATAGAGVYVSAQSGRAANRQATQHGTLLCRQGMPGPVSLSVRAENVRHLQTRT